MVYNNFSLDYIIISIIYKHKNKIQFTNNLKYTLFWSNKLRKIESTLYNI